MLTLVGCRGATAVDDDVLDRDAFIAVYVDLRIAAMDNRRFEIHPVERDSVLALHGVTEGDLLAFAEAHGRDVEYMAALWTEISGILSERLDPDGVGRDDPDGGGS